MRQLLATRQFEKDLKSVPAKIQEQADALLFLLRANPADPTLRIKKLSGIRPPAWRLRIGSFRLVYTFSKTQLVLLRFRDRKDVYKNL